MEPIPAMTFDFDKHSVAVNEVLEWLRRDGVLAHEFDTQALLVVRCHVIDDLQNIERFRDPEWDDAQIQGDVMWSDVKRTDDEYFQSQFSHAAEFKDAGLPRFEVEVRNTYDQIQSGLSSFLPEVEVNTVYDDLEYIMLARAVMDVTDLFWEKMFQVYRAGGYPCGWKGAYPEGQLVVLSRPS
jgi:hypothetical protein